MVVETLMKLGMTESDFWKNVFAPKIGEMDQKEVF